MWFPAYILCLLTGGSPSSLEPVTLWPLYQEKVLSPCQYVGFSFAETPAAQAEMNSAGAEICALGSMWVPVRDPGAPFGCGVRTKVPVYRSVKQLFAVDEPFNALIVQLPTNYAEGDVSILLWRETNRGRQQVARRRFEQVPNEFQAKLAFEPQTGGRYALELKEAEGTLGVWIARGQPSRGMRLFFDDREIPGEFLEFALVSLDDAAHWRSTPSEHRPVYLARERPVDQLAAAGLNCAFMVGNWNNGGFPYYPDWFYDQFPDATMIDARGQPITAGLFGEEKGWPGIDHPVIVDGTKRHIEAVVDENKDASNLVYWILGGEALYPTYLRMGAGWPDYGTNAVLRFQAWLRRKYGSVERLNASWKTDFSRFSDASPPLEKAPTARFKDWICFHFSAMAERMSWHYAAVRNSDRDRLIVSANHGNPFWSDNYAALGADLPQYADATDGFEMGQIMEGDDPGYFNLWYASALAGLGKVGAPSRLAYKFPDPAARGGGRSYTPETARRYCMEALGAGWWHLGLIQWSGSLPDGEWGVKGTPAESEISRVFSHLKRARPHLESSWPVLPRIGLYLSKDRWILRDWHPDWTAFHVWAVQHQFDHAILWESQLLRGEAEPYPVLISLHNDPVSGEAASAIRKYLDRGGTLLSLDTSLPPHPRIHRLRGTPQQVLERMPELLAERGVKPFCSVNPLSTVRWSLEIEPLTGRRDLPIDLSRRRCVGQSFLSPGPRIRTVAVRTPTYCSKPGGFQAVLRLKKGGPSGSLMAEGRVPSEKISDNAWTEAEMDVAVEPGCPLYLEITTDSSIPERALGVWAAKEDLYGDGQAFVNGEPVSQDIEFKIGYEVSLSARNALEVFTLFDGLNFFVPLINVSQEEARVELLLDPEICPEPMRDYVWEDVLSATSLGQGALPLEVTVPAKGYRLLSLRWNGKEEDLDEALRGASKRTERWKRRGQDTSFQMICLERAEKAKGDRAHKAKAHLRRLTCSPRVAVHRFLLTSEGDIELDVSAEWPDGRPFADGVGVLRAVPLPNVAAILEETSPGRYKGTIPSEDIVLYDMSQRAYLPYEEGLQGIVNIWKGRTLAQAHRILR